MTEGVSESSCVALPWRCKCRVVGKSGWGRASGGPLAQLVGQSKVCFGSWPVCSVLESNGWIGIGIALCQKLDLSWAVKENQFYGKDVADYIYKLCSLLWTCRISDFQGCRGFQMNFSSAFSARWLSINQPWRQWSMKMLPADWCAMSTGKGYFKKNNEPKQNTRTSI